MDDLGKDSASQRRLTGDDLYSMFSTASVLLERNVDGINALNVFPVPDGDTGTNMFLTLRAVVEEADSLKGSHASDVAAAMARGALMGARGNSGVILSQFFRGMAVGLEGTSDFGAEELVGAFHRAREHAYKAVGEPVEGTILTVISSTAEAAQGALDRKGSVEDVCEAVCEAATESVAKTPTMLAVLRDAGVVDAGGQGLAVILEGVRRSVKGEATDALEIAPPEPVGVDGTSGAVSVDFLEATEEELYGYCTQFMIEGEGLDTDSIRTQMVDMAHSAVVVGDESMVKIHVHAKDPGPVISTAVSHGILSQVNIQNMDEQHGDFSVARRSEASATQTAVAVITVAMGKGLEELFTSLGASRVIAGGDTMNPRVQDMIEAVNNAPSDNVVILPNNGNILPAATQAAEYSEKTVKVVPTRSIPQGIASILSFNPDRDLESNFSEMEEALESVRTGEVTEAVRSVTINDVAVEEGRLIGLLDRKLVTAGDDVGEVVVSVLGKADLSDGDLVTLYWGDLLTEEDANAVVAKVTAALPGVEAELVEGGQPHYHFLISIE